MTTLSLVRRSLRFYWRTHLGVLLGAAVGSAILIGALSVGDSVRDSLRSMGLARIGKVDLAIVGENRLFRSALAAEIASALNATAAPVLLLRGMADNQGRTAHANNVQVLGVDGRFWALGGAADPFGARGGKDVVVLNRRLADHLGATEGDTVLLRIPSPTGLPGDAPLAGAKRAALTLRIAAVTGDDRFGRFSLQASQVPPYNAYVPLKWLQDHKDIVQPHRANLLLLGGDSASNLTPQRADGALRKAFRLADAQLELRELPRLGSLELRSGRVFLDPPVAAAAAGASPDAVGILTYFVNEFRCERTRRTTPYSTIAAIGPLHGESAAAEKLIPEELRYLADDEIAVNAWLADDLDARPGDTLTLTYTAFESMGGRKDPEDRGPGQATFRIRVVVAMAGLAGDRGLMPDVPGLAEIEDPREWKFGVPVDFKKIRTKDDEYWKDHRGTPKAFVNLRTGRRLWGNRFGDLTAVRYPLTADAKPKIEKALLARIDPASVGLFFQPVRERALAASGGASDFGQLFIGFSFFLVVTALLLTGLLFAFGTEQRGEQVGLLLALGWPARRVRRLLLLEGVALAVPGVIVGALGGVLYAQAMLHGLATVWRSAVNTSSLRFHTTPLTMAIGVAASLAAALLTMRIVLGRQIRRPARELLALGQNPGVAPARRRRWGGRISLVVAALCIAGSVLLPATTAPGRGGPATWVFFATGSMLLTGGLAACYALLCRIAEARSAGALSLAAVAARNTSRRTGRSLAVVALLACGTFLVIAVGANRTDPLKDAQERCSGTGGFALFGQSALPLFKDPNSPSGRKEYGLDPAALEAVRIVPLRVSGGEDASCLNLNRAQTPRLLGVRPEAMASRRAFTFVKTAPRAADDGRNPWHLLDGKAPDGAVPAVGDEATVLWGLGKSVGDTIEYADDRGRTFRVRLVATIADSIFQGALLISEEHFIERFPSAGGYRMLLVDAPPNRAGAAAAELTRALADVGLEIAPAAKRLAVFVEVQNTYISIFQVLGGLGLVVGSVGLGLVVLRNVLERRAELALLRAVGFRRRSLQWLILCEHWALLGLGLLLGVAAGMVAVIPALRSPSAHVPYAGLGLTVLAVAALGVLWTHLAAFAALRSPLLPALRSE